MRKAKHQHIFRSQNVEFEDLAPKIITRTPANYRQRKLAGQSSAFPGNRTKQRETNYFKIHRTPSPYESPKKDKVNLTQQEIRASSMYKLLEEEIANLIRRQEKQFAKLEEMKRTKDQQISQTKKEQHDIKLQIWELRNETMELKQSIQAEQQQAQKLMEELGITDEELDYLLKQQDDEQNNYFQNNLQNNEQSQQYNAQG